MISECEPAGRLEAVQETDTARRARPQSRTPSKGGVCDLEKILFENRDQTLSCYDPPLASRECLPPGARQNQHDRADPCLGAGRALAYLWIFYSREDQGTDDQQAAGEQQRRRERTIGALQGFHDVDEDDRGLAEELDKAV